MNETGPSKMMEYPVSLATLATGALRQLSAKESDTLGEIGNIGMGAAATALFSILGRKVRITTPKVSVTSYEHLATDHATPFVVVNVEYTEGFSGSSLYVMKTEDVKLMTDIMMGGNGAVGEGPLSDLHISAISEAMNQMMGAMSTAMAEIFERIIKISPPQAMHVRMVDEEVRQLFDFDEPELIQIRFMLEIEGLMQSQIIQILPMGFGRNLVEKLLGSLAKDITVTIPDRPVRSQTPSGVSQMTAAEPQAKRPGAYTPPAPQTRTNLQPLEAKKPAEQPSQRPANWNGINAHPIQLTDFGSPSADKTDPNDSGIDLILDVPLQISVELGQCRKTVQEILELNLGSIVTLDKMAGEPVDVVVNGKAVAKGEVIVIDDSYGIRITEVINNRNRNQH